MSGIPEEQEERIIAAMRALVSARVQAALPGSKRGLRAIDPIRARVPAALEEALARVVSEVTEAVAAEVEDAEPFGLDARDR
jgi:hypothetical protein